MAYLSSRTNMPAWKQNLLCNQKDLIKVEWLLDSNRRYVCAFIAKYDTHIMNSYIVYPLTSVSV